MAERLLSPVQIERFAAFIALNCGVIKTLSEYPFKCEYLVVDGNYHLSAKLSDRQFDRVISGAEMRGDFDDLGERLRASIIDQLCSDERKFILLDCS